MKAGKVVSLVVAATLAVVAALMVLIFETAPGLQQGLEGVPIIVRIGIIAGALGVIYYLILCPVGLLFDRAMREMHRFFVEVATSEQVTPYRVPKWLIPLMHAFTGAVEHFRQQEVDFRNQLRDLEVRHRVSEVQRRQIEAVLHALRDGVLVTDSFNEIVMANDMAANALGFETKDAIHHPLEQVIQDQRMIELVSDAKETMNTAERFHVEHELAVGHDENGNPTGSCLFDLTLACVEDHKHEVGGVVTILHDLTREREISQMKSDFVSKASHELRTPLSSIRAYVEMLVDGEAEDESSRQEFYQIIHNETERLGRLIDNMLNISRIEAGIVQIEREIVDPKELIERAVETIGLQAQAKNISLHTKLAPVSLQVEGDADMLYQAVLNLASNAVKYTPEGGRVTLTADSDNLTRSVVISVVDTGLGIPPDAVSKLFEKFFRVENYKRIAKGTGLGLNLCKHIVETLHNGQIGVESKLGMGSKFWFSIPMRYAGSQAA